MEGIEGLLDLKCLEPISMYFHEKIGLKLVSYVRINNFNNLLVGEPKFEVLEVVQGLPR